MTGDDRDLRELYERATDYRKEAFSERPYFGSPGAPAQDETNASNLWAHLNAGYLTAYEHTRWWKESKAVRDAAVLGDWSWLGKVTVEGPDASRFIEYATVADVSDQGVGEIRFTPMVNANGKVAIEGITFRLAEDRYLFTQSAAKSWFDHLDERTEMDVAIDDVTPDYTVFAVQGPLSIEIVEEVTGESFRDLEFSQFRETTVLDTDVIVDRAGVTGELGYEFLFPTESGKAPDLWRTIRDAGREYGLRELGFRAQMIPHTEVGIATAIKDYLPARLPPEDLSKLARHWISAEELEAIEWDLAEHLCSPAELGWGPLIDLDHEFHGRSALLEEADEGGPAREWVGLRWNDDDVADLYADQFREVSAAPPPDFGIDQFRMSFLPLRRDGRRVGWASGRTYSPNVREMISNGRVSRSLVEPGTEIAVEWGGFSTEPTREIRAEVVRHPIVEDRRRVDVTAR